jgi:hypothetical protein
MARRRAGAGSLRLNPARMLLLTIGAQPTAQRDPDSVVEALWWRHRERIITTSRPGHPPWGWWQFEGPPELVDTLPTLYAAEDAEAVKRDRADLDARRAAYLAAATG